MAISLDTLDYTAKDFSSIRRQLYLLIDSVFADWTDRDEANFGNILVALFSRVGDVLTYYQDRQSNESRWTTAKLLRSMLAHCKLIDYTPPGATAATVTMTLSIPAAVAGDVTFPAGTTVRTTDVTSPAIFELLEDAVIPAGSTSAFAATQNSTTRSDSLTSTGLPDQRFRLSRSPYLAGSLAIVAGNGTFTEVDNFLDSTGTDRHFTVVLDQNDVATVVFGDGNLGAVPTGSIAASYKTWNGLVGKVAAGTVTRVDGTFTDSLGTPVRVTVTNEAESTRGAPRASVDTIRALAPRSLRTRNAAVTREDFENGALGVTGVARALHLTKNEDESIGENQGFLWVVPVGGGTAGSTLLSEVRARFFQVAGHAPPDLPAMTTYQLTVLSANYLTVDVQMTVYKRQGFTATQVKANVLAALAQFFAITVDENGDPADDGVPNPRINFGYYLQDVDGQPTNALDWSVVLDAVQNATGVRKVGAAAGDFLLNELRADVELTGKEFPVLGTVTIVDGDTGLTM